MTIHDGFPNQRLVVVPRPRVAQALRSPASAALVVTDAGYFPEARMHGFERNTPIEQAVVLVCISGAGWCVIDGEHVDVRAGQAVVLPPGSPHAYGADQDDPWTLWWFHAAGEQVPVLLAAGGFSATSAVRDVDDLFHLVALVEEIVEHLEHDAAGTTPLTSAGPAWHCLAMLAAAPSVRSSRHEVVQHAREYLRTHSAARVSVAELARIANMSASHFAALFKEQVGVPVLQYQTQLRMQQARLLLDTTERPVAEIADEVGYRDAFYFSRHFRSVHGVSPLAYRRSTKG